LPRRQVAEQEPEQRRLARAVRADDPHLVAPHDRRGQVADDRPGSVAVALAVSEAHPLGLDDEVARALGLLGLHPRGALALAAAPTGLAHGLECTDSALVSGAAGFDPLADPRLLLGQFLVEERRLTLLGGQQFPLALEERGVVA